MDFGCMNDNRELFKVVQVNGERVKLPHNGHEGIEYSIVVELHPDFKNSKEPINFQLLQTLVLPNFFPQNQKLSEGWLAGRHIFEKNWTEVLKSIASQEWNDKNYCSIVEEIKILLDRGRINGPFDKSFVLNKIPQSIKNELVNAYLCHLWNTIVIQRLETVGPKPQLGDIINPGASTSIIEFVSSSESVQMTSVVMPIPGNKATRYPNNKTIKNIYTSIIPKFETKWFFGRMQEFAVGENYRPILCHVIDFDCCWFSNLIVSLKFKLPLRTSYENVIRGLRTCVQLASGSKISSPFMVPMEESASSNFHVPAPIKCEDVNFVGKQVPSSVDKSSKSKQKETHKPLANIKTPNKKPTETKKSLETKKSSETKKNTKTKKSSETKKTGVKTPRHEKSDRTDTRIIETRSRSKRTSADKNRSDPPITSKSIEVITISDSSDSEIEPTKKKRKTRPLPPSPKNKQPTYNPTIKIKLEKGVDSTTSAENVSTPVRVKLENLDPVRVKVEPRGDVMSSKHTDVCSSTYPKAVVKQEPVDSRKLV